jgi:SpoVK/Ycf46/Vps4 family AAA+-type ATPase
MPAYRTSREHLFEELRRLDLVLNLQIARQRSDPTGERFNDFCGLFIAEDEIDRLVVGKKELPLPDSRVQTSLRALETAIADAERKIAENIAESLKLSIRLSLPRLAEAFQLSPFDIDALLICLAPELDLKYEKLYAYLQNDVTRKRPTTNLILNLCCRSLEERLQARTRLLPAAPLCKYELILPVRDPTSEQTTALARSLKIDERILNYLLGAEAVDESIASFARVVHPQADLAQVLLPAKTLQSLAAGFQNEIANELDALTGAAVFRLQGPEGSGKRFVAEALCRIAGVEVLVAEAGAMISAAPNQAWLATRLFREAKLRGAVIFIDQAELLLGDGEKEAYAHHALGEALRSFNGIVFVGSRVSESSLLLATHERLFTFTFSLPTFVSRKKIWQRALAECGCPVSNDIDLDYLADRFNFTAGRVCSAVAEAKRLVSANGGDARSIAAEHLNRACRAKSRGKLPTLARKMNPIFTWNDIILPDDCLGQLQEVCAQVRHRQRVFGEWGFDSKISLGKGLSILFVGPSGTGKTMAAEIVGNELALDLYKIDLSCIVSKYIGETEKNLNRIFAEAEQSNAVLFFDEADAVFGKRSEVKDSHDRYANIETNYLLQKMEEYEGIVILASNFQKNIDEAFTRRLRFIIDFPFPERDYRYRIWTSVFPSGTPLDRDIDFDFLAQKLKLSGGNIRNIALGAAFLAAANSGHVRMEHIICATKREFQKVGKLCVKSDFEHYFELVSNEEVAS